jgi:hypothetical protein
VNSIRAIYDDGGRIEGGRLGIAAAQVVHLAPSKAALVRVDYSQAEGTTFFPDGHQEVFHGSARLAFLFTLRRGTSAWAITAIQPIKEPN